MTALFLVVFLLAQFGFAYIAGQSAILFPVRVLLARWWPLRKFVEMVECPACLGFWMGGACWAMAVPGADVQPGVLRFFFWGCVVSGSNFILGRATRLI